MSTRLKRLSIPRAYQAVYEALQDEIMSGRIPAGAPLPTETDLAERFGVTRHTVREGMRVLEQSGFVRRDAGRRLHVTLPHAKDLAPRASRALLMQRISFKELWEIALPLEVTAVELAMPQVNDAFIAQLEDNLRRMEAAPQDTEAMIQLDIAFHTLIAEASRNRVLLLSREPVSILFYPSLSKLFHHQATQDTSPKRIIDAHQYIINAFKARDLNAARTWMSKHIYDFRRGYYHAGLNLDDPVDTEVTTT